jgi:hypothetical protein
LIDDALQHYCRLWHPLTGYGFAFDEVLGGGPPNKRTVCSSSVLLLKPHGSVTFRYRGDSLLYVGLTNGVSPTTLAVEGGWQLLLVAPSATKALHSTFMGARIQLAEEAIAKASRLVIAGYSFPRNDRHLDETFRRFRGDAVIVNPDHANSDYLARLKQFGLVPTAGFRNLAA